MSTECDEIRHFLKATLNRYKICCADWSNDSWLSLVARVGRVVLT